MAASKNTGVQLSSGVASVDSDLGENSGASLTFFFFLNVNHHILLRLQLQKFNRGGVHRWSDDFEQIKVLLKLLRRRRDYNQKEIFFLSKKELIGEAEKEESMMRRTPSKEPQSELLRGQLRMSSGLERFQSVPSSFLGEILGEFLPSQPETDTMFPRFSAPNFPENLSSGSGQLRPPALSEILNPHHKLAFPSAPLMMYHRSQRQIENFRNSPNLTRLESSPAVASFPHLNADNGYAVISSNSLRDKDLPPITCPPRQNSLMPQISDIGTEESGRDKPMSLPKYCAMDRFLQFQDAAPCRVRAKRGFATHPRSVAERVRRSKISERMRKLQELVPNMDKQTNTAAMLDLAVIYIKDLQKQVKMLAEGQAKCTCSSSEKRKYPSNGAGEC